MSDGLNGKLRDAGSSQTMTGLARIMVVVFAPLASGLLIWNVSELIAMKNMQIRVVAALEDGIKPRLANVESDVLTLQQDMATRVSTAEAIAMEARIDKQLSALESRMPPPYWRPGPN